LATEICCQLDRLEGLDDQFAAMVAASSGGLETRFEDERRRLHQEADLLARQKHNLLEAIKQFGPSSMMHEEIKAIEAAERQLLVRRYDLENRRPNQVVLPESAAVLRQMLEDEFRTLAVDSPVFGKLMRSLVTSFFVYAVRLCDGGHLLPRAKIQLNLGGTFPDLNLIPEAHSLLTQDLTMDFFTPPQRERIREQSVALAARGMMPKAISQKIDEKPTATAVQNALKLNGKMLSLGLTSPYVIVLEPPDDYPKLRRHKHERYVFKPLDGYERPAL
jgi:hypothetical protein